MASASSASRRDSLSSEQHDDLGSNRRRRGVGIVTPNACTECRRKRAKCDGNTPCQRCTTNDTTCVYEIQVRMSKDTMRSEIEQLQKYRRQSEQLLAYFTSDGSNIQSAISKLRGGQSLEKIVGCLTGEINDTARPHSAISSFEDREAQDDVRRKLHMSPVQPEGTDAAVDTQGNGGVTSRLSHVKQDDEDTPMWDSEETPSSRQSASIPPELKQQNAFRDISQETQRARSLGQNRLLEPFGQTGPPLDDVSAWTKATDDPALVEHLLALYFSWEYPVFATMSKEHFLQDFRAGRERYCSSMLVNAVLAVACRLSFAPATRTYKDSPETAGDQFFAEAKRLLDEDDLTALTTIQALGLMSIRECSCGRDGSGYFLSGQAIRLAVEQGFHRDANSDSSNYDFVLEEVRSATFWGAFSLDAAFCLALGKPGHLSATPQLVKKPVITESVEASQWLPYTDEGVPFHRSVTQPSNVRSVFHCFCDLSELVHRALYILYNPGRSVTVSEIIAMYYRYLNWYNSLDEVLRLGTNFTPAVLFAHMYYHFAILSLLQPFIKLRFIGTGVSPRDICTQAADAITTLIRSYDNFYTLKRTPFFVPFIGAASSVMHLFVQSTLELTSFNVPAIPVGANADLKQQIMQSARGLRSMSECHGFASRALDILKYLAHIWHVPGIIIDTSIDAGDQNAVQNTTMIFAPELVDGRIGTPTHSASSGMYIESLEEVSRRLHKWSLGSTAFLPISAVEDTETPKTRTLFLPFWSHGTPVIAHDEDMVRDGFEWLIKEVESHS